MIDTLAGGLWEDGFAIGNPRVDLEHRMFVGLVHDFAQASERADPKDRLLMILEEIALFARFHFKSEENVMQFHGFPDLERHRGLHRELMEGIGTKMMQFRFDQVSAGEVARFLHGWFRHHVLQEDAKMAGLFASP